jgi:hypothetical protein
VYFIDWLIFYLEHSISLTNVNILKLALSHIAFTNIINTHTVYQTCISYFQCLLGIIQTNYSSKCTISCHISVIYIWIYNNEMYCIVFYGIGSFLLSTPLFCHRLMTNEVMALLNMKGNRGKRAFGATKIFGILKGTICLDIVHASHAFTISLMYTLYLHVMSLTCNVHITHACNVKEMLLCNTASIFTM